MRSYVLALSDSFLIDYLRREVSLGPSFWPNRREQLNQTLNFELAVPKSAFHSWRRRY